MHLDALGDGDREIGEVHVLVYGCSEIGRRSYGKINIEFEL